MSNKQVTVSLQFDVTVPVNAETDEEAETAIDNMDLNDLLAWSGCASYNTNILEIRDDD